MEIVYGRCMGIKKIHSQKSREKSEELVVERSLKLGALNLNWLGVSMDPHYMDNSERVPHKATLKIKIKIKIKIK